MGSWVEDFNSFQPSTEHSIGLGGGGFSSVGGLPKKPQTRKEKLEAELKLLQWHKLANEAAIKAALVQTKNLKEQKPSVSRSPQHQHSNEDARWMKKVIQEEHMKPLEVSRAYVLDYEAKELRTADLLSNQVDRHITTLKSLRDKLETKQEASTRTEQYRSWQRDFHVKKNAVMLGKTLQEIEIENSKNNNNNNSSRSNKNNLNTLSSNIDDEEMERFARVTHESAVRNANSSTKELSTVLDSLNKLAELEKRISTLEKDNAYDSEVMSNRPIAQERTTIEFKKKRVQDSNVIGAPVGVNYAMKPKKTAWTSLNNNNNNKGGGKLMSLSKPLRRAGEDTGFFLTEFGDGEDEREDNENDDAFIDEQQKQAMKREFQRQRALAPAGQKNLRNRVNIRKTREKELNVGSKRHDEAMKELLKRRNEQQLPGKKKTASASASINAVVRVSKGASAGVKTKNKHLQEFENIKSGHQRRKIEVKKIPLRSEENNNIQNVKSQTAPPALALAARVRAAGGGGGLRVPATKGSGTVTRRTDAPMRSHQFHSTSNNPKTAPSAATETIGVAVAGVGGLRVIREMRGKKK